MKTLTDVHRHIKMCLRYGRRFNWLGFVEDADLSDDVKKLFTFEGSAGAVGYDWVHGNGQLDLLQRILIARYLEKHPERYTIAFSQMYSFWAPGEPHHRTKEAA